MIAARVGCHVVRFSYADLWTFASRRWGVSLSSDGRPYLRATSGRREYFHRVVCPEGEVTDHRNGDTLDDRRENLRPATRAENARNCRPRRDGSVPYRGVRRSGARYRADIAAGGVRRFLGTFPTAELAAAAYAGAAAELHGEFSAALRGGSGGR